MPVLQPPAPARAGLPDPSTIRAELVLQPPAAAVAGAEAAPAAPAVTYRILRTNQMDDYDDAPALAAIEAAVAGVTAAALDTRALEAAAGENFQGTARKAAKISLSPAAAEVFVDLAGLIASLPAETDMTHHQPPIGKGPRSKRVTEEHRNVQVRAFLYAASREEDNDFHLIVGRDPSESPLMCMTVEISGTPPESSVHSPALKSARAAFKAFFAAMPEGLPGFSYDFYDPPIPLDVTGSLFFDITHASGGRPGPQDLRPFMPVIWELHPISAIVLEP